MTAPTSRLLLFPVLLLALCMAGLIGCGSINPVDDEDGGGDAVGDGEDGDGQDSDGQGDDDGDGADPCDDGTCACDDDTACDAHEVCAPGPDGRACTCAPGYGGSPCEWIGVVEDPGFEKTTAWSSVRDAVVDPAAEASADPGLARIGTCALGTVTQTIAMPSYGAAGPLVAEITYNPLVPEGVGLEQKAAFGFDASWTALRQGSGDQFVTERACLGEGAYGGERVVAVSTDRKPDFCSPSIEGELHIDRFDVVPAQPIECAAPGQVVNGDAETDGGWTFSDSKGGQATLAAGVGADASRGLSLTVTASCGSAAASTPVSIPVRPTALELWWRGTAGSVASLAIDDATIATLRGDGGETRLRMCAPAALLGRASHLSVSTYGDAPGFCGEPLEVDVAIDDVQLVDEPACAVQSGVVDGGFESLLQPFGAVAYASGDAVQAVAAPGLAHGGEALLELTVANRGVDPVFVQPLQVPVPTGNGEGPALRYWHNVPANPISTLYRRAGDSLIELPEGGGWVEERVCLDPDYAGRPLRFSLFLFAGTGAGGPIGTTEVAYVDDISLGLDAACAAGELR